VLTRSGYFNTGDNLKKIKTNTALAAYIIMHYEKFRYSSEVVVDLVSLSPKIQAIPGIIMHSPELRNRIAVCSKLNSKHFQILLLERGYQIAKLFSRCFRAC
jgi:hypothetical protein